MKCAHKKDCLTDCVYDVSKYILHDDYYQITKQFTTSPLKVRKHFTITFFTIFIPTCIIMVVMVVLGIYYQASHQNSQYYNSVGIALWATGLSFGIIVEFGVAGWFFHYLGKFVDAFTKLAIMGCISANYQTYPILIQNALFMQGSYPDFDFNNYWIVTTNWWIYAFAVFFDKLNQVYVVNHRTQIPLIAMIADHSNN